MEWISALRGCMIVSLPPPCVTPDEPVTNPAGFPRSRVPESALRLELLGGVSLRDSAGQELTAVLAQPKRLALLAYLATAPGRRPRRRDSVLGLLWPESDEARARNALNRSLSFLRGWLGSGVIVSRGKDEVGTAPERLWCDAAAFDEAVARDDLDGALELYTGALLEGFYVAGAPELESWIERERSRLRRLASTAAWTLAARSEEEGDFAAALRRARQALELDLFDEPALRRLLTLLDRAGDRLGAARVYADFERLLERDYEMEPSPETRALMEVVRSRVGAHLPAEWMEPPSGEPGAEAAELSPPAGPSPPVSLSPAPVPVKDDSRVRAPLRPRGVRGLRRPAHRLVAASLVAAATAGALLLVRPAVDAAPADDEVRRIVVLPFAHSGEPAHAYLAAEAAAVLSGNLSVPQLLDTVDPAAVARHLGRSSATALSERRLAAAAHRFGARYVLVGGTTVHEGQLRVEARLVDVKRRESSWSTSLHGPAGEAFGLFDHLSAQLLGHLASSVPDARTAALSAASLPALRAYLEGMRLQRHGRWVEAHEAYRSALNHDSTFALAFYRYDVADAWIGGLPGEGVRGAVAAAVRHAEGLPEAERLLIAAWNAYRQEDYSEAEFLYARLVRDRPDLVEGWFRLAELRYHQASIFGRSYLSSREAFERVLLHDPSDVPSLLHLLRIAAAERREQDYDAMHAQLLRHQPDGRIRDEAVLLRAHAFGGAGDRERALEAMAAQGPQRLLEAVRLVAAHTEDLAGAARLAAAHTQRGAQARLVDALVTRANIELSRGRPAAMRRVLAATSAPAAADFHALSLALPWLPATRAELREARLSLEAMRGQEWTLGVGMILPRRVMLEGLLAVREGDEDAARGAVRALRGAGGLESPHGEHALLFARLVEAELLRARGRPEEALAALGPPPRIAPTPGIFSYGLNHTRYLRAVLLADAGRLEEAFAWFSTFPDPDAWDAPWRAAARLGSAEILERQGRLREAAAQREIAARLWRDAESGIPIVSLRR
jgi:DNA-binding SARP family transcriptional activator/TolB-like protein